jgi:hypothetical protein
VLSLEEFGAHLLQTNDLDPIYVALHKMKMEPQKMKRWLLAYWCFYSAGFACWASEYPQPSIYWRWMRTAAENTTESPAGGRWPRGFERRHARGEAGIKMVASLEEKYQHPEEFSNAVMGPEEVTTCTRVIERAKDHYLFGPWISFKIADMLERCLGAAIKFEESEIFFFDQPKEAAIAYWRQFLRLPVSAKPRNELEAITAVCAKLTKHFGDFKAPPRYDRPVGIQEVETILCKWKSHQNGSYPLLNDINEARHGIASWAKVCATALSFQESLPSEAVVHPRA